MTEKSIRYILPVIFLIIIIAGCSIPILSPAEKTFYIAPYRMECEGEGPQMCMLVKENPDDEYTYFYDRIEGFNYEEGYEYVIKVREETVDNPPAGGSSIRWVLVEVVSKTEVVGAQSAAILESNLWDLELYHNNKGELVDLLPGMKVTAEFKDNQISGSAGCNNYFASYQLDADRIDVNDIGMTEMFCVDPENIMQQEIDYLNALASAANYQVSDERLIITDTNGEELLIYSRFKPLELTGTEWELVFYNDGEGAFVSVLNGTQITALFEETGKLSGTAGCNEYSTAYQVDENLITIDSAAITMMYCADPEGIMEQESAYLAAVESAGTFQIERNNLTMENASGVRVLSYMAEKMEIGDKTVPDVETTATSEVIAPTTSPDLEETTTPVPTDTPQPTATPEPTSPPEQTYTLTPAASATPTPLPNLVFEDDFKYDTGWIEYKTETHSFIRKDDAYYVSVNTANGYIWSIRSLNPPDVILETNAAMVEGSDQAYYGVVCRFEKGANYYFMVVNDSGAYAIGMVKGGGKPVMLVQGANQEGIVLTGNQLNHLRGDCIGDTLTLYVNGEKLLETRDDSFSEGEVGLIVLSSYKNYQVQVKFDYFAVYEPD